MRTGQPQPEPFPADQQIGGVAAGEQVVDELQALSFLAPGDREMGPLEALSRRRHRIVGGPQHAETGRTQIGQAGQLTPQSPGRRQVQVDQAAQGHAALRGPLSRPAVLGEFHGGQAAASAGGVRRRRQVAGQQIRGHTARLPARRARDRVQVDRTQAAGDRDCPGSPGSPTSLGDCHTPGGPLCHGSHGSPAALVSLVLAHPFAPSKSTEVAGSRQLHGADFSRSRPMTASNRQWIVVAGS